MEGCKGSGDRIQEILCTSHPAPKSRKWEVGSVFAPRTSHQKVGSGKSEVGSVFAPRTPHQKVGSGKWEVFFAPRTPHQKVGSGKWEVGSVFRTSHPAPKVSPEGITMWDALWQNRKNLVYPNLHPYTLTLFQPTNQPTNL